MGALEPAAAPHSDVLVIEDEHKMAMKGTPRRLNLTSPAGASRRSASTKSMRDDVYMPEFKQDSTAVSTTAFMT